MFREYGHRPCGAGNPDKGLVMNDQCQTYEALMTQWRSLHSDTLAAVEEHVKRGNSIGIMLCLGGAVTKMMLAGLTEWRMGEENPTEYFKAAVADGLRMLAYRDKPHDVNAAILYMTHAAYAHLLVNEVLDPELGRACFVPIDQRKSPVLPDKDWFHIWDWLVFELAESGEKPAGWDEFMAWLEGKRGTRNFIDTMKAYMDVIESAKASDRTGVEAAVKRAERCWNKRRDISVTWMGEHIVDFRLACMIKKAEQLNPSLAPIESIHRWRW